MLELIAAVLFGLGQLVNQTPTVEIIDPCAPGAVIITGKLLGTAGNFYLLHERRLYSIYDNYAIPVGWACQ